MKLRLSILVVGLSLCACDVGGSNTDSIAQAVSHVAAAPEEAGAKVHATERMAQLQAKTEAAAAKAKEEAWAAIIRVPDDAPGDLDSACLDVVAAYDGFMQGRLEGSGLQRWQVTKQVDLDQLSKHCHDQRQAKAAACQASAFRTAGSLFGADDAPYILSKCEELVGTNA